MLYYTMFQRVPTNQVIYYKYKTKSPLRRFLVGDQYFLAGCV